MASCTLDNSEKKQDVLYLRHSLLVKKMGRNIIKSVFDMKIPPSQLHLVLQKQANDIKKFKDKKKRLSQQQYSHLYPPHNQPSSDTFDLTLLVCLLQNFCGLDNKKCWHEKDNQKIPDTDASIEADITRLRNIRNEMCHRAKPAYQPEEFETKWSESEKVLLRLAKHCNLDVKKEIDDLKTTPLEAVTPIQGTEKTVYVYVNAEDQQELFDDWNDNNDIDDYSDIFDDYNEHENEYDYPEFENEDIDYEDTRDEYDNDCDNDFNDYNDDCNGYDYDYD